MTIVAGFAMNSCDDYESYADKRDYELSSISKFIANPIMGEIKGKPIKVISEAEFLANDTTTDVEKNEFVLFENTGVYMQIVNRGCGSIIKNNENAIVLSRVNEYNINTGQMEYSNDSTDWQDYYEKYTVSNRSGSLYGSFMTKEDNPSYYYGMMYLHGYSEYSGYSPNVLTGWLIPLRYVKLGRPSKEGEDVAKVRIIVPHDSGHLDASRSVAAYYYELTYQRGI